MSTDTLTVLILAGYVIFTALLCGVLREYTGSWEDASLGAIFWPFLSLTIPVFAVYGIARAGNWAARLVLRAWRERKFPRARVHSHGGPG